MTRLWLSGLLVLPALALAQAPAAPPAAPKPTVLVATAPPHQGSLPRTLTAYGVIQGAPGSSETLSLLRAGQVTRITVAVGQRVKQGDLLLALTADPAALATYRQAVTTVTLARSERARLAQMLAQQLATRDQLALADKAVADAQSNLDLLAKGGGGSAEQAVTAPFDGIVSAVPVAAGARVAAQAPLVTLDRTGRLVASLGVEPGQRGVFAPGQPAQLEPLDGGGAAPGTVRSVGAMLDPVTRLVPLLVDAAPPAPSLLPGGPVRAVVQVGVFTGWLVPRGAVGTDGAGAFVFQATDGKAVRVDVQVTGTVADTTVVAGPIDRARPLIVTGNAQLQNGASIREDTPAGVAAK